MKHPNDTGWKLLALLFVLRWRHPRETFRWWLDEVWRKNLQDFYCCSGHMCGCQAITVWQQAIGMSTPRWISRRLAP